MATPGEVLAAGAEASAVNLPGEGGAAVPGTPPSPAHRPGEEVVELRERASKTFATDEPGVYRTRLFDRPVHHRQGERWLDVQRGLVPTDLGRTAPGRGRFDNAAANEFRLSVAAVHRDAELASLETEDGLSVAYSLEGARPGNASPDPQSGDSTVVYRGILPGVDLRLASIGDGLKEDLILKSRDAPDTFVFPLTLDGLSARIDEAGSVLYEDEAGVVRFETPPGSMADASLDGDPTQDSLGVAYRLIDHQGGQALEVRLDRAWLDDPARVYPVTVDPTYRYHYNDEPFFYADTFYYSANTTSAYTSSPRLAIGRFSAARYRSYLQFGANAPSGMTPGDGAHYISNATLGVYNYSADNCNTAVYVKRTTQRWEQYPDQWASQLGPPYDANDGVQTPAGCIGTGWMRFNVTSMARNWENGTRPNHGFALLASHSFTDSYRSFRSQDYSNAAYHPYLEVDWRNAVPEVPDDPDELSPAPGAVLSSAPTSLKASYDDADGDWGWNRFRLERQQGDGTWSEVFEGDGVVTECCRSQVGIPTLAAGDYRYSASSTDGTDASPWTPWYAFSVVPPPPTTTTTLPPPAAPTVSSPSHPDPSQAYDENDPVLAWEPGDITSVDGWSWTLDQEEATVPDTTSEGTATTTSFSDLSDGTWWFHVAARASSGAWSPPAHFRLTIDTAAIPAPVVSSSTHPDPERWFSSGDPELSWTNADPPGALAHSYALDQDPTTTPDEVSEGATASASFPGSADGTWWFHVRSQVPNGRWSDTAHYRVNVDTTAPGAPGDPRSTSHLRGVSSPDRTVNMSWSAALDEGAGVSGYRWSFTTSEVPPTTPDGETAAAATAATSDELGDGVWFFHARALDTAGNLGPYASFGPIVIDGAAGLILPRLGLDPTAASDGLGMEQFFPLDSSDLGSASAYTNLDNGNLVVVDDDATIAGQGLDVGVRHVYNSGRGDTDDGLGRGWNLSVGDFSAGLEGLTGVVGDLDLTRPLALADLGDLVDGVYQVLGQVLEFSDADGTTHRFVRRGGPGARWASPPGVDLRVVEQRDLLGLVSAYDLVRPDGVTYRAENIALLPGIDLPSPTWRLTQVSDRNGNQLDYSYGRFGLTPQIRLAEVTHNRRPGVMVALTYDDNANVDVLQTLPDVVATDPASGASRSWARTIDFDVEAPVGPDGLLGPARLTQVTENAHLPEGDPARQVTRYAYGDGGLLAGVSDPRGATTTFAYEDGPDAAPRLATLTDRRSKPWTWAYGPLGPDGGHETVATSPLGVATTYAISGRAPVSEADERIGGGNAVSITDPGTDAGPLTSTYSWSANRLVASTDGAGATTRRRFNDLGLLAEVTTPSPNAPDAPAGAAVHHGEVRHVLTYDFLSPGGGYDGCDPAAAPANPDISSEGYCATVGQLSRVAMAANVAEAVRISDFTYDGAGNLTLALQRGAPDLAQPSDAPPGPEDRATTTSYHPGSGGLVSSVDGPRPDVADVTTYGSPGAADFGYHASGEAARVTDAEAKVTELAHTPYGLVGAEVDRDGHRWAWSYDEAANLVAATNPDGEVTTAAYDANDNQVSVTSPRGNATATEGDFTTIFTYDANEWMTTISSPGPAGGPRTTVSRDYADDGTVVATTSARGTITTYSYWPNRALRLVDAPADGEARALSESFYDAAGRVVRTVAPVTTAAGERPESTLTYSPAGTLGSLTQTSSGPGPRLTRYAYSAHGEQVRAEGPRSVDGVVAATEQSFDPFGQVTEARRRLGADRWLTTTTGYDAGGNPTSVAQPAGDGASLTATFAFNALDRLAAQTADPQNPGHIVDYAYDGEGAQTERVDKVNGAVVRRTETTHNPDDTLASVVATDYDPATGAPSTTLATCNSGAGAGPASGYDADANRLETRTLSSDGAGGCDAGTLIQRQSFTWDERSWMTNSTQEIRSPDTGAMVSRTQAFAWDPDGARASLTHGAPGEASFTTTYAHNDAGQATSTTDWRGRISTTSYLPSGVPESTTLGSGVAEASYDWHPDATPEDMTWRNRVDQVLRSHATMGYDGGGQRISEYVSALQPDGITLAGTARYGYDLADRLTSWASPFADPAAGEALSVSYILDDAANVTLATTTGATSATLVATIAASYPNSRLASRTVTAGGTSAGVSFTYDGLGQEIRRQGDDVDLATGYDPMGHTTSVDDATAANDDVDTLHDGAGRLIARVEPGAGPERAETTLYFYWGASDTLAEETDAAGATLVRYACDPSGNALAQQSYRVANGGADPTDTEGTWRWLLPDVDANVATQVDDDGEVLEQSAFDPYGAPQAAGSSTSNPGQSGSTLGFQGAITDPSTGSVVLGPRRYDPGTARFTTADSFVSAGLDLGLALDPLTGNRYLFAGANPVAFFDDGHWPIRWSGWWRHWRRQPRREQAEDGRSYTYTYDLGRGGTPEDLLRRTVRSCSRLFPIKGCFDDFQVGEKLNLRRETIVYVQGFPVLVREITDTSFTLVALEGHPEGQGRNITFRFLTENGRNKLNVSTSKNGSALTRLPILSSINFFIANSTWDDFADNIRASTASGGLSRTPGARN